MRKMRDSGIEWIDNIPAHWNVHPLYCYFGERKNRNMFGYERNLLSLSCGNVIRKDIDSNGGLLPESFNTYNTVEKDDIIIRPTDLQNDKRSLRTGLVKEHGIITSAYIALKAMKNIDVEYVHYLLHSFDIMKVFYNMGNGVRQGLNFTEFSRLKIFEPPIEEQKKIAAYLDHKCSEIDALTADIQSEIETLEEYKRSVITEAVTKGLDPDVEMKDSGIEWIEKIPVNWELSKIGQVYTQRNTKVSDTEYPPLSVTNKGIVYQLDTVAKSDAHDARKLVKKGDFAINSRSDRRGSCGISKYDGSVSLINIVLAPVNDMHPGYYDWLFHTVQFADEFYKFGHGIVDDLWTTNWQDMKRITIPMPSFKEQHQIAVYLDQKCFEIDSVISDKKKQLETLSEYKKSLIYENVTGKKEVTEQTTVVTTVNPLLVIIGKILDKISKHRGKIQVLKFAFLIEYLYIPELQTQYYRYPQGPYDIEIDKRLKEINRLGWFDIHIDGNPMDWSVGKNYNEFLKLSQQFPKYDDQITSLINSVGNYTENHIGHIATLFAAWNDFILDGIASPSDEQIVKEVVTNWTENKKNTSKTVWHRNLNEMKTKGIIPKGNGLHTKKARR